MVGTAVPGPSGPPTALTGLTVAGVPTMGMAGLPLTTGRVIFADAVNGSDGNDGSADYPVETITQAYSLATDGANDVIVIVGDGSTAATQRLSSTLTWAKDATHLVGMTAPTMYASRARISTASGATTNVNPLVEVTAQGCIFANFSLFQGVGQSATAEQLWKESGQRNSYSFVHFGGMGSANGGGQAASYAVWLNGGGERYFNHCTFGVDTVARSAANTSLLVSGEAARDVFEDCEFPMYATATSPFWVNTNAANSLNRWIKFKRCSFWNVQGISSSALLTIGFSINASQNGDIRLEDCTWYGATDLYSGDTARLLLNMPAADDAAGGQMVAWDVTP